ncbi:MAG TPA: hypothetical protein VG889_07900 [Rhizomicrobium sp.]|nr:hypothetical protein [Rhizomicrobium sp.]
MLRYLAAAAAAALLMTGGAQAQSSFTESCSNFGFVYSGNSPAIEAMCLKPDGTPNATTMILTGIMNVKGVLTNLNSGVPSSFQSMCGSIEIFSDGPIVTLSAYCNNGSGGFNETSLQLNNINNQNGVLVQGQ